jgi:plasmid stabilization system protein ParE
MAATIFEAIQSLVPFPHIGHSRPESFQPMGEYVIAYAPEEKPLAVIAVLHGRRSPRVIPAILRSRG